MSAQSAESVGASPASPPESLENATDSELLAAMANGEVPPLGVLYARYGGQVLVILRRYARGLGEDELADVRQEVFLTALDAAPRFSARGSVRSWLFGIAIRLGRTRRRRLGLRQGLLDRFGQTSWLTRERRGLAAVSDSRFDAEKALAALPEAQREVLLLHVVEGLGGPEIAAALGISEKTVWTRLHRARRAVRKLFDDKSDAAPVTPATDAPQPDEEDA